MSKRFRAPLLIVGFLLAIVAALGLSLGVVWRPSAAADALAPQDVRLVFSRDGTKLASAAADGGITVLDLQSGRALAALGEGLGLAAALAFSPDGEVLASGKDNAVILWDLTDGIDKAVLQAGTGRSGKRLAFRPGGDRLATIVDGAETVVWELQTESVSAVLSRQTEAVTEVAYNADGRFLAHQAQIGQRIRTKELNSCAS